MRQYRHILVAIDFSEISEAAAEQAFDLAGHYRAELTVLHIIEHFPEHLPHYRMSGEGMDPQERPKNAKDTLVYKQKDESFTLFFLSALGGFARPLCFHGQKHRTDFSIPAQY